MYRSNSMYDLSQYIQPPILDAPKREVVEKVEEIKEEMELKPESRLEKDQEEIDEKEEEAEIIKEEPMNDFENLKVKLLNVKNKPLFIKRNKDKIKSLEPDEQREFLKIAKGIFDNL